MRVLAVSNLFPSSLEPNRATFNRQHFEYLSKQLALQLIVPLAWPTRLRGGRAQRADAVEGQVTFPTFYYTPRMLSGRHGQFCRWSISRAFKRACAHEPPDLIYATWIYPDAYAALALARDVGVPLVVKAHGSDLHSVLGVRQTKAFETLRGAAQVITVSQDLERLAKAAGVAPTALQTIYNGVDSQRFAATDQAACRARLNIPPAAPMLLFIGNLKPIKGIDRLLDGFARAQTPDAVLYLLGAGALRADLEAQSQRLGLANRVHFIGPVEHEKVPEWISAADAVALLSRNEGVPNVLLEAKACGRPVLASAVGGIPEVVSADQDGCLLDHFDASAVGQGIDRVLNRDRWDRSAIAAGSRRFDWQHNIEATKAVFEKALGA